jgi:pimeloyl-ACP methyl ester carboxylesterase
MNERKIRVDAVIAERTAQISVREWRVRKPKGQVICFHGFGVSGSEFAPMAERLNQLDYDVIAPDWFGHGDSEYLAHAKAYSWDAYAKCLTSVIRRYHSPMTHYVGTSWGGAILLLFLLSHRLNMQSAVLVDVPLRSTNALTVQTDLFEMQKDITFPTIQAAHEFLQKHRPEFSKVPERFKTYFDNERFTNDNGVISFKYDPKIISDFVATINLTFDRTKDLLRIREKVLFLYGKNSPHRRMSDFMAICARMPNIHYRDDLPGGHPPMLFQNEQIDPIVDFIKRSSHS